MIRKLIKMCDQADRSESNNQRVIQVRLMCLGLCLMLCNCSLVIDTECQSKKEFCGESKESESGNESGEQAGNEAGEQAGNEAGEQAGNEAGEQAGNAAGEENNNILEPSEAYHNQECLEGCEVEWSGISSVEQFSLGSELSEDEQPIHDITVSAFEVSVSEVTVAQYSRCVAAGHCIEPSKFVEMTANQDPSLEPNESRTAQCNYFIRDSWSKPMNCIDYCEAQHYITWLSNELGVNTRLLSESEWVYVASDEGRKTYPWGDDLPTCEEAQLLGCEPSGVVSACSIAEGQGQEPKTCEMIGNVGEWVADHYQENYEQNNGTQEAVAFDISVCLDGFVIDGQEQLQAVVKGGDWRSSAANARPNNRVATPINIKSDRIGFRVARPIGF